MSEIQKPEQLHERKIVMEDMPPDISEYLKNEMNNWIEEIWHGDTPSVVNYEGIDTYVWPVNGKIDGEGNIGVVDIFLVDADDNGKRIGLGIISTNFEIQNPAYEKPYVGFTETIEGKRREGLGIRRLRLMNQMALQVFGLPLNSVPSDDISLEAMGTWQKLLRLGEAEAYEENDILRWRFKA